MHLQENAVKVMGYRGCIPVTNVYGGLVGKDPSIGLFVLDIWLHRF